MSPEKGLTIRDANENKVPPQVVISSDRHLRPSIPDSNDHGQWLDRLAEAFGVANTDLAAKMLLQCIQGSVNIIPENEGSANALIASVSECAPKDPFETMLVVQMTALHNHCMEMFSNASRMKAPDLKKEYLNMALKLSKSYAALMEKLNKYRQKGRQKMTVEHVHVHNGGQAIVGSVTHQGAKGQ